MGREIRVHCPGLVFHVVNRGNNRQAVFLEPDDQKKHYWWRRICIRKVSGTDEVIVADKTKTGQTPEGNYDVTY